MMIHRASSIAMGHAQDMLSAAAMLEQTDDDIAALYAECAGGEPAAWRAAMDAETWYTAATAVECGLATEVAGKDAVSVSEPLEEDPEEDDDEPDELTPAAQATAVEVPVTVVLDDAAMTAMFDELRGLHARIDEVAAAVSRETPPSTTPDPPAAPAADPSAALPDAEFNPELIRSAFRKVTT
jgi:hypothetical protein